MKRFEQSLQTGFSEPSLQSLGFAPSPAAIDMFKNGADWPSPETMVAPLPAKTFALGNSQVETLLRVRQRPAKTIAPAPRAVGGSSKRIFDILLAGTTLLLMAPVMIIVALLIYVTMGGPVLFAQQRVGFNGARFKCYKFRSMVPDAQERLIRHLAENAEAACLWRNTQKLKNDPRITWLGHVLRKTSLDELPQLFNVLRGEMSCIGPRPVIVSELERYGDHAGDYTMAKPGLTGMWQVSGRSNTTYAHRINCDRFYVRRWSFALDMLILLRTIPAVMRTDDTA